MVLNVGNTAFCYTSLYLFLLFSNSGLRSKYDTGILGRSSSVADKEKSSHRYDKVEYYDL